MLHTATVFGSLSASSRAERGETLDLGEGYAFAGDLAADFEGVALWMPPGVEPDPARIAALARFIEYVKGHEKVWCARRVDIARHWHATHPFSENSK